jgi:hypothetical protein
MGCVTPDLKGTASRYALVTLSQLFGRPVKSCRRTAMYQRMAYNKRALPFPPRPDRRRRTLPAVHREVAHWLRVRPRLDDHQRESPIAVRSEAGSKANSELQAHADS